jgi:hypothetical protein
VTEDTTTAELIDHSYALYSKLDPNELPRETGPLLAILKGQDVDQTERDVYKNQARSHPGHDVLAYCPAPVVPSIPLLPPGDAMDVASASADGSATYCHCQ